MSAKRGDSLASCYNVVVSVYEVATTFHRYPCAVERGILSRVREYIPVQAGKVFVSTTRDVWDLHGHKLGIDVPVLFFPPGSQTNGSSM